MSSNEPAYVNTPTYALTATTSSALITFTDADAANYNRNLIVTNLGTSPVAIATSTSSGLTVSFPGSATVPVSCTVIAPGSIQVFKRDDKDKYLAAITNSGSSQIIVKLATGV